MAKYNEKLPCTPEEMDNVDWDMFEKFGQFFMRKKGEMLAGKPADDDFYGIAYQAGKAYDFSTMQVNAFIWQYGANIWDETQAPKGHAEGVVNSPEAVKALDHYLRLTQYMPPVVKTGGMDIFKTDELFREGKVASNIEWIGFAESSINAETSKVAGNVAFCSGAGPQGTRWQARPLGEYRRAALRHHDLGHRPPGQGGRGLREMVAFPRGAASVRGSQGGQSAIKSVYNDPKYVTYRPWNRTWAPGLDWQKDTWHIPEFFELLVQGQEQFDLAITGKQDAKTTLDNMAAFQEELLKEAGHIEE